MRRPALLYAGLGAATAAVFSPSLRCGFVGYDDRGYVVENARVLGGLSGEGLRWALTTTRQANWHPLTWLSLQLDATLGGAEPAVFHATSVLLHVAATLLLLHALRLATGELWRPAVVAALFALHPLRVESVTWISERKDVLASVFWMATTVAWIRFRLGGNKGPYAGAVVLFALGLLAKPMLVTLPFVLLLLDRWPLRRKFSLVALAPLFALSAVSSAITVWAQRAGGAVGSFDAYPLGARLANAVVSAAVYLRQMVWPQGLATPYPYRWENLDPARVLLAAAVLAGLTAAAILARKTRPWALVGWLWYLGTLVPVSGLVQVGGQAHADRYTYIPMVGIVLWLVWDASVLLRGRVPAAAVTLCLAALSAVTVAQQAHWKDGAALMRRALAVTEGNSIAHDGYGLELYRAGQESEALPHFQEAVRLSPESVGPRVNLAASLSRLGRFEEAAAELREVARLRPGDPAAGAGLAAMLLRAGKTDEAEALARSVLAAAPDEPRAHEVLGVLLALRADAGAADHLARAGPEARRGQLWVAIALSLLREGRTEDAERALRHAVRTEPTLSSAHTNLGVLLARTGRIEEALPHFEEAVRLVPEDEGARRNLEKVRARMAAAPVESGGGNVARSP